MSLERCSGVFSGQVYCGLLCTWQGNEAGLVPETLYSLRWSVGMYFIFKESCIVNF